MRSNGSNRGFTLIELLLAIAIIGMIATVVMVAQRNEQSKRRDVKRVSDTRNLQQALSLHIAKFNTYPIMTGCISGTDAVSTALAANAFITPGAKLIDPLTPTNPASCYYYDGNGSSYTLRYTLEANSSAGTAGNHLIVP